MAPSAVRVSSLPLCMIEEEGKKTVTNLKNLLMFCKDMILTFRGKKSYLMICFVVSIQIHIIYIGQINETDIIHNCQITSEWIVTTYI